MNNQSPDTPVYPNGNAMSSETGISLYNYFRGQALAGILANSTFPLETLDHEDAYKAVTESASKMAKFMLKSQMDLTTTEAKKVH